MIAMLWLIPSAILLLVAIHQRWRMYSVRQSAWKGGGFGMFSDIQRTSVAAVVWALEDGYRSTPLRLDPSGSVAKATHVPTARNIRQWGEELVALRWQRCGENAHEVAYCSDSDGLTLTQVTLHHLFIDFDGRNGVYTATEGNVYSIPAKRRTAVSS